MKASIVFFLLIVITCCGEAQENDISGMLAALYFRQADSASSRNFIWQQPLYGPMLLVDPTSRIAYANMPDSARTFTAVTEGVYKGNLPQDVMIANTSINWQGRVWAVILWPLPIDKEERLTLMLHESFHRIQDKLGLPAHSPTIDHLATMEGRIYFLLELQALRMALAKPVHQRMLPLSHALLFRQKRQQLFPTTFGNESILEMNEGLAEYTGMLAGRSQAGILKHLYNKIDGAASRLSLIRSMAYITGPVYGYLLYEKSKAWTTSLNSGASFSGLIRKYYKITISKNTGTSALIKLGKQYKGDSILLAENVKEKNRQEQAGIYTRLFTQQPLLMINLVKMNIVFNPNNLFDLGKLGTVYPTAEIKDVWGRLSVTSGGMLMKDWKVITIPWPAMHCLSVKDTVIQGNGWQMQLNNGWQIAQNDNSQMVLVKQE